MDDHSDHNHHGPGHVHGGGNQRAVGIAALLTGGFMVAEVVGGLISGSLALLADAGHMLTDCGALALAWFAFRLAKRPADWKRTYGFDRFSVLAAFVNGITLFAIAAWIVVEAARRLRDPGPVLGGPMLWIAIAGLVVNIVAFWVLSRGEKENLNVRAALLHVAGDLLGSVAAIVAAIVILMTGWLPIDPLLSVLVAVIILRSAYAVVRESGHILLEAAPGEIDRRKVEAALVGKIKGVLRVHHVHAWSITQDRPMMTLEADVADMADQSELRKAIKAVLRETFAIDHATVELSLAGQHENPGDQSDCPQVPSTRAKGHDHP